MRPSPEMTKISREVRDLYTLNGSVLHDRRSVVKLYTAYREYSGTVTPNFKQLNKRALPFNHFHLLKSTHYPGLLKVLAVYDQPAFSRIYRRDITDDPYQYLHSVSRSHLGDSETVASRRLASKFNSVKTNVALMFHERKQTADLIQKNAERIVHGVIALKKLDFKSLARHLRYDFTPARQRRAKRITERMLTLKAKRDFDNARKLLANTWMEVQFGWRPLINDIYGAAELLSESFRPEVGKTYAVKSSGTSRQFDPMLMTYGNYGIYSERVGQFSRQTTTKILALYRPNGEASSALVETGITNPALVVWDAVPFSFVVDWFLPVAGYLQRLQAYSGFDFVQVNRVRFTKYSIQARGGFTRRGTEYGGGWFETVDLTYGEDGVLYDRDSIASIPSVPLEFRDPVSTFAAVTSLAIASQQLRSLGR